MNKILSALAVLLLSGSIKAQSIGFVNSKKSFEYVENDLLNTGYKSCKIYFYNTTDADLTVHYKEISVDFPDGWTVSFCDNSDCYPSFPTEAKFRPIMAGDTANLKLDVYPDGTADTAFVTYAMWDENYPDQLDTVTYQIMARWGLNAEAISDRGITLFPNPASSAMTVNTNGVKVSSYKVYDLQGQLILFGEAEATDSSMQLNVKNLTDGLYILSCNTPSGIISNRFQVRK